MAYPLFFLSPLSLSSPPLSFRSSLIFLSPSFRNHCFTFIFSDINVSVCCALPVNIFFHLLRPLISVPLQFIFFFSSSAENVYYCFAFIFRYRNMCHAFPITTSIFFYHSYLRPLMFSFIVFLFMQFILKYSCTAFLHLARLFASNPIQNISFPLFSPSCFYPLLSLSSFQFREFIKHFYSVTNVLP